MECKMQNANYFRMMECKMLKFSWVCLFHPKCQIFHMVGEGFFGFFLSLEAKIQNEEWILFANNFA
jgi:hypothetical protein